MKCKWKPIELGDLFTQEDNSRRKMEDFNNQPVTLDKGQIGIWYNIINKETSFGGLERMSNYLPWGSRNLLHLIWVCWSKTSISVFSQALRQHRHHMFLLQYSQAILVHTIVHCLQKQSFVKWKWFNDFMVCIWWN